jgi:Na+-driven multidrug efflux pump
MLRASALFFPVLSLIWLYNGALRGVGQVTVPFLSGVTELVSKIAFLFILSGMFGIAGVWYTSPIAWALGCAVPAFWFHRLYRRGGSLIPA